MIRIIQTLFAIFLFAAPMTDVHAQSNETKIVHLLKSMFDSPDNPLSVNPIVVSGDYAIAGWVQGDRGGRALLKRKEGEWKIHLCAGDALKDAHMLERSGIDHKIATDLASMLAQAEVGLEKGILAKFTSFEGIMMVDENAGHSAHGHHKNSSQTGQSQ